MVGMGQAFARHAPERLWSILGSCVAVALCDPRRKVAAMCHVVLPSSAGRGGSPGKFADTAVPHMLQMLREMGISREHLTAKIAGGASMFGNNMPLEVGHNNAHAVTQALHAAGIPISGQDVGGNKGRRVTLDCAAGELHIEIVGCPSKTL
jgi:chemotaxis protein CheD